MLLRPSKQSGTSAGVCACLSVCVRVYITDSERQQDRDRKGSLISCDKCCTSEHMCLSARVCHRCACLCVSFWTRVYPYLDGRRIACQSTSACEASPLACCLPCNINNSPRHNPNLASPQPASEQHQWYMGTSGRPLCYRFSAWWMETSAGQSIPNLSPTVLI